MEPMLIILKNQQQIIGEVDEKQMEAEPWQIVCHRSMSINWQADQKRKGLSLNLIPYPPLVMHLVKDVEKKPLIIGEDDIVITYLAEEIKPEVLADYERRKQEAYGTVAIIHAMPSALQGRA